MTQNTNQRRSALLFLYVTLALLIASTPVLSITQQETFGAESNPTGNPIGGGIGYNKIILQTDPHVRFVVNSKSELLNALDAAVPGDIVYVDGSANIDLTGIYNVTIPSGVTLASNRGQNGASGGRLFQTHDGIRFDRWDGMLNAGGSNARITGLRLEGPFKTRDRVPKRIAAFSHYDHFEVDNCEVWGWVVGVQLWESGKPDEYAAYIHHNIIRYCQMNESGYGVAITLSKALIEANIFDHVRHAVAASGLPAEAYEARYNIIKNITSHAFDMHGGTDRKDGTNIAGDWLNIHHNTVETPKIDCSGYGGECTYAVGIRGDPQTWVWIHNNWFYMTDTANVFQTQIVSNATRYITNYSKFIKISKYRNMYGPKKDRLEVGATAWPQEKTMGDSSYNIITRLLDWSLDEWSVRIYAMLETKILNSIDI